MILFTGAAGYIGSHCVLEFIKNNKDDIIIFDNLETGHIETIETLKKVSPNIQFVKGDLKNFSDINFVFEKYKIDFVLHFAAYSLVKESVSNPLKYYQNNVFGSMNLLRAMIEHNVLKIVFSSSAAVYGVASNEPIKENVFKQPINPYGMTKLMIESILDDFDVAYNLKSVRLRYFNAVGADSLTRLGEWHENETHLVPNILKSALNENSNTFKIFGNDYNTFDGTCIRDYVDVDDLARAHFMSYLYLLKNNKTEVFNIGSQRGYSVKEVFDIAKKVVNKEIKTEVVPKREGDPAFLLSDSTKAKNILNWQSCVPLDESIKKAFLWEEKLSQSCK